MKNLLKNRRVLKECLAILGLLLDAMLIFGVVDAARGNTVRGVFLVVLYLCLGYASSKLWIHFFETVNAKHRTT